MSNKIYYLFHSGKKPKFIYYGKNYLRMFLPSILFQLWRKKKIESINSRLDKVYIEKRVNYYNQLSSRVKLPPAKTLAEHKLPKKQKVYFFDTYEFTRWFPQHLHWGYEPGDIIHVPSYPSIVKSRPLSKDNTNSILLKLDKVRHFVFLKDSILR